MYLAICLPDWNSLDSVRRAHSRLEGSALVFFALLVAFDVLAHLSAEDKRREALFEKIGLCCFAVAVLAEIAAYPYGQRNDTLSAQVIGSLDTKSREAFANASGALTKSGAADTKAEAAKDIASKSLDKSNAANDAAGKAREKVRDVGKQADELLKKYVDAENKLLKLQFFVVPRTNLLMGGGGTGCNFVPVVEPFKRQAIEIRTDLSHTPDPRDSEELRGFVGTIEFLLGQVSGWSISEAKGYNGWGITLAVRKNASPETKKAGEALASAFADCGVTDMQGRKPVARAVGTGSNVDRENGPPDTIVLFVGEHPR
jgi:hypothetical protein